MKFMSFSDSKPVCFTIKQLIIMHIVLSCFFAKNVIYFVDLWFSFNYGIQKRYLKVISQVQGWSTYYVYLRVAVDPMQPDFICMLAVVLAYQQRVLKVCIKVPLLLARTIATLVYPQLSEADIPTLIPSKAIS